MELRLRLGLNTGLVVVGRIGDDLRMDYTAVSYARMLQAQGEGEKARTYLVQAIDLFRQMGMTWDLVRAEQALHSIS